MISPLPWVAEHAVDAELAGRLIGSQFPQLRHGEVSLLAEGWDNTVYLVDGDWAFRFPRRAISLPGVRLEIALLPLLAPRVPLPVPVPVLIGAPAAAYPWPFWGGRLVPGTELAQTAVPDSGRGTAATQLGAFLRALHDPQTADAVRAQLAARGDALGGEAIELRVDPLRRTDARSLATRARERLARLEAAGLWAPSDAAHAVLHAADTFGPSLADGSGELVLVHGDLHLRHLLVDAHGRATGVIDWGDACLADPAVDLSLAYAAFDGADRAALVAAYGPIRADREVVARVLAMFICAALAEHAADVRAAVALGAALAGLARAVAG